MFQVFQKVWSIIVKKKKIFKSINSVHLEGRIRIKLFPFFFFEDRIWIHSFPDQNQDKKNL